MKFLILVNSTSLGNIHLHKVGLCFRPITISEYEEIVSYLDRLVSDELVETVLSIKVDGMSDTMIYYSIAISSRNERLSHLQTEFLKMIAYKKSKKAAIYEFIELKNSLICETSNDFYKYFQDNDLESLLNSILGFIKFINGKNSYKKRDNLCSSFDDLIGNKGNHSLSFYTNGLFSINLNDLTEFINVLDSYNSEYQFYFLNNLINFFGDENLFNPLRIILDDVSFIEFLLLHENEDKKKSFVLKCGILCSGVFPDEDIKSLEKRLEGLYEIRSHIIHGSTELISKLESKYGSYLKFNDIEISNTFRNRQSNLLSSASIYLDFYLANILRKFINDNDLVKFIKNN